MRKVGTVLRSGGQDRVAISAHRGGGEHHPRGTWEAFQTSVDTGAEYVEFDVRRTGDGHLVVFHDSRAERAGAVPHKLSRAALERRVGRTLPSLRDLLDLLAGRARAHIDIKETGYEAAVVTAAAEVLGLDAFLITGVDSVMIDVKRVEPRAYTALSLGRGPFEVPLSRTIQVRTSEMRPVRRTRACGADAVAMNHRLARVGALTQVARHGIPAMIWTVNEPALIRRFVADHRVAVVVTDRPELAVELRRQHEARTT
jgi:glycerophosphoryl diester phosphodiesterase